MRCEMYMLRHLVQDCNDAPTSAKKFAQEALGRVNAFRSTKRRRSATGESVACKVQTAAASVTASAMTSKSSKVKLSMATYASTMAITSAFFGSALAEFVSEHKVSFNTVCSPEFRCLQSIPSSDAVDRNALQVTFSTLRRSRLPKRAAEAVERIEVSLPQGPVLSAGYTMLEDGWMSRAKDLVSGVVAGRPGSPAYTVAILPIAPSDLHGLAIARSAENIILECSESGDLPPGSVMSQFMVRLRSRPIAYCTDSAGANVRTREILTARFPGLVCIPSFAHVGALECGDILAKGTKAKAIAKAPYLVNFSV